MKRDCTSKWNSENDPFEFNMYISIIYRDSSFYLCSKMQSIQFIAEAKSRFPWTDNKSEHRNAENAKFIFWFFH